MSTGYEVGEREEGEPAEVEAEAEAGRCTHAALVAEVMGDGQRHVGQ